MKLRKKSIIKIYIVHIKINTKKVIIEKSFKWLNFDYSSKKYN